jgi:DNA polymerase-1
MWHIICYQSSFYSTSKKQSSIMKKTTLIDSNYICYRAKFATGHLQYGNVRTGILFGFFNQLITAAEKTQPDQIVFFWDSKKSKRREIFPDYKIKRRQERTELEEQEWKTAYAQFNQLRKKILPDLGFNNQFLQSGYESDDLIAQYVFDYGNKEDICVVTGDDDLLQLLEYCIIYNPAKESFVDTKKFTEIYGISPSQWSEVKKIAGCNSDCVPGVQGVAEKTAIKYLTGDLKTTTKKYQDIVNNGEVIERNHKLVVLPFEGTQNVIPTADDFNMANFLRFCRRFGLNSFRQEEKQEKIKQLFMKGKHNGEKKSNKTRKRRKSRKEEHQEGSAKESGRRKKGFAY